MPSLPPRLKKQINDLGASLEQARKDHVDVQGQLNQAQLTMQQHVLKTREHDLEMQARERELAKRSDVIANLNNDVVRLNADLHALRTSKGGLDASTQQRYLTLGQELEAAKGELLQAGILITDLRNQKRHGYWLGPTP